MPAYPELHSRSVNPCKYWVIPVEEHGLLWLQVTRRGNRWNVRNGKIYAVSQSFGLPYVLVTCQHVFMRPHLLTVLLLLTCGWDRWFLLLWALGCCSLQVGCRCRIYGSSPSFHLFARVPKWWASARWAAPGLGCCHIPTGADLGEATCSAHAGAHSLVEKGDTCLNNGWSPWVSGCWRGCWQLMPDLAMGSPLAGANSALSWPKDRVRGRDNGLENIPACNRAAKLAWHSGNISWHCCWC